MFVYLVKPCNYFLILYQLFVIIHICIVLLLTIIIIIIIIDIIIILIVIVLWSLHTSAILLPERATGEGRSS